MDELVGAFRPLLSVPRTFVAPNSDIIVPVVDPVVITPSAFPRLDQLVGGRGSQTWNTPIALFANNEDTLAGHPFQPHNQRSIMTAAEGSITRLFQAAMHGAGAIGTFSTTRLR